MSQSKKILWANPYCLLDTSSGAALSVREMLIQLKRQGYEVKILGATIFDHQVGMSRLGPYQSDLAEHQGQFIRVNDELLEHQLLVTKSIKYAHMQLDESATWYVNYCRVLDEFKPDLVWFYDANIIQLHIAYEAKLRNIKVAAYLANSNYSGERWTKDVDLIITDSKATRDYYKKTQGYELTPVGKFIPQETYQVKTQEQTRERVLFINPCLQKGVIVLIQLALILEKQRPDIVFEIVESRVDMSQWQSILQQVSKQFGEPRDELSNIVITPNTQDMRPIYARARLLLVPSLAYESGGRVIVEALLNGIPVFASKQGGMPEVLGDSGVLLEFPKELYQAPYSHFMPLENLQPIANLIIKMYDDEPFYQEQVNKATLSYERNHNIELNTQKLMQCIEQELAQS